MSEPELAKGNRGWRLDARAGPDCRRADASAIRSNP